MESVSGFEFQDEYKQYPYIHKILNKYFIRVEYDENPTHYRKYYDKCEEKYFLFCYTIKNHLLNEYNDFMIKIERDHKPFFNELNIKRFDIDRFLKNQKYVEGKNTVLYPIHDNDNKELSVNLDNINIDPIRSTIINNICNNIQNINVGDNFVNSGIINNGTININITTSGNPYMKDLKYTIFDALKELTTQTDMNKNKSDYQLNLLRKVIKCNPKKELYKIYIGKGKQTIVDEIWFQRLYIPTQNRADITLNKLINLADDNLFVTEKYDHVKGEYSSDSENEMKKYEYNFNYTPIEINKIMMFDTLIHSYADKYKGKKYNNSIKVGSIYNEILNNKDHWDRFRYIIGDFNSSNYFTIFMHKFTGKYNTRYVIIEDENDKVITDTDKSTLLFLRE